MAASAGELPRFRPDGRQRFVVIQTAPADGPDHRHRLRYAPHGNRRKRPSATHRRGLATVETRELERYLTQYIAREDVSVIVVGKPLKMNGAPSETMRFVLPLVARLHRTYPSIEVVLYDERFTSAIAHRAMLDGGLRKMARRNRALVDKISATIILEDFMSSRRAEQHR